MTATRAGDHRGNGLEPGRPRDASQSRQALLSAAQALFGQHGFEGTTTRDIGERAGVDAALIARYFGSKTDLYVAAVAAENREEGRQAPFTTIDDIIEAVVSRIDTHGPGPVVQSLIRMDTSDDIRIAAKEHLQRRLIEPLIADMDRRGVDDARLRAEVALAALIGVSLGRSLGWFDDMAAVPRDRVIALVLEALRAETGTQVD